MKTKFSTYLGTKSRLDDFIDKSLLDPSRMTSFLRGEVLVSQLGMGTYRLHHDIPEHAAAVGAALCSGVNLIDTAPNYTFGGSEKLIGKVLESLGGPKIREQFVVITKGGILQGAENNIIQGGMSSSKGPDGLIPLSADTWGCFHPEFLERQLQASLERLKLESLDVFLLHNPEIFLEWTLKQAKNNSEAGWIKFYHGMESAFTWLENKVLEGKILYYGVSSNQLQKASNSRPSISITSLIQCAEKAAKQLNPTNEHHFQVVQFPLNPLELEGYEAIFESTSKYGLDILINRPFNAMRDDRLFRLARREFVEDENYESIVEKSLDCIEKFEQAFLEHFVTVEDPGFHLFRVGSELREVAMRLEDSDHLHELMNYYFLPHTQRSLEWLEQNASKEWLEHVDGYLESWEKLEIAMHGKLNRDEYNQVIRPILGDAYTLLKLDDLSLDAGILRFLMSFPARPVILNGMRTPHQVKSSTEALIHSNHPSFEEIINYLDRPQKTN